MKTFQRPINLNGAELMSELASQGIFVEKITDNADGTISFETTDEAKAKLVVEAHNGNTIPSEPSVEDKLASVGLNLSDLKSALGL